MKLLFTETEVIELIAKLMDINQNSIKKEVFPNGGLATQIDGSISLYDTNSVKMICKIRTNDFHSKIGGAIDSDRSKGIFDLWIDAPHRIKNNYKREAEIYSKIDAKFKGDLPIYYGSHYDECQCALLLEYIENDVDMNESDIETEMNFLALLHEFYYEDEKQCRNLGAYFQSNEDFLKSKEVYYKLINCIETHYANLYNDYLYDLKMFVDNIGNIFPEIVSYGRTFCHGDFCYSNIKKSNNKLKIFDWEAAGYFNPEFDVITFLARSINNLNDDYIIHVLSEYYAKNKNRINKENYQKCLLINLHLCFLYGYLWILPIFIGAENKDFIYFEMGKFIHLYDFFKNKKLETLI